MYYQQDYYGVQGGEDEYGYGESGDYGLQGVENDTYGYEESGGYGMGSQGMGAQTQMSPMQYQQGMGQQKTPKGLMDNLLGESSMSYSGSTQPEYNMGTRRVSPGQAAGRGRMPTYASMEMQGMEGECDEESFAMDSFQASSGMGRMAVRGMPGQSRMGMAGPGMARPGGGVQSSMGMARMQGPSPRGSMGGMQGSGNMAMGGMQATRGMRMSGMQSTRGMAVGGIQSGRSITMGGMQSQSDMDMLNEEEDPNTEQYDTGVEMRGMTNVGSMQGAGMGQMQGAGMGQMQGAGMGQMQGAGMGQMQGAGMRQMQGAGMRQTQGGSMAQVQNAGMRQVQGAGMRQVQGAGMRQVQGASMGQVQGAGMRQVQGAGMRQVQGAGMRQVQGASMGQVQGASMGQVQGAGMRQMQGAGMGQVQGGGMRQMQGGTMRQLAGAEMNQKRASSMAVYSTRPSNMQQGISGPTGGYYDKFYPGYEETLQEQGGEYDEYGEGYDDDYYEDGYDNGYGRRGDRRAAPGITAAKKARQDKDFVTIVPILHANPDNIPIPPDLCTVEVCRLCDVWMNAAEQAKAHYDGKSHSKRIKRYFEIYQELEDEGNMDDPWQIAEYAAFSACKKPGKSDVNQRPEEIEAVEVDPEVGTGTYCSLCDATFNTAAQAKLHYDGKTHQRRERHQVRMRLQTGDMTGFFGAPKGGEPAPPPRPEFTCDVCNIHTTSQEHLDMHLGGAKHKAKVKKLEKEKDGEKAKGSDGDSAAAAAAAGSDKTESSAAATIKTTAGESRKF